MIPKRIFYVWGAGEPKKRDVSVCIQTWRQVMPDYEIIELNQNDTRYFDYDKEIAENKWFRTIYDRKMWAMCSDYIRIKTLYEHGGIYLDTDVSVLKSFDGFLKDPAFVGFRSKEDGSDYNYVEPAILGAQKGNPFIKRVLDFFSENSADNIWNMPIFVINHIFQHVLDGQSRIMEYPDKKHQKIIKFDDIAIYPERFFCPLEYGASFSPDIIEPDTCSIHWWGSSWHKTDMMFFMKNKHRMTINEIDRKVASKVRKKIYLFGIKYLPIGSVKKYGDKKIVSLFGLPLMTISEDKKDIGKIKIRLFGIIPIIKIQGPSVWAM